MKTESKINENAGILTFQNPNMRLNKDGTPRKKNKPRKLEVLPRKEREFFSLLGAMRKFKPGTIFYTLHPDKDVSAFAANLKIKCLTERCLIIEGKNDEQPIINRVTKVTIL